MSDRAVIYVDLKRGVPSRLLRRQQPWYWIAKNAMNQKVLCRSSEHYTNQADALAAIGQVFGAETIVYLRQTEQGNQVLRLVDPPTG
jgi:hypothetical protein